MKSSEVKNLIDRINYGEVHIISSSKKIDDIVKLVDSTTKMNTGINIHLSQFNPFLILVSQYMAYWSIILKNWYVKSSDYMNEFLILIKILKTGFLKIDLSTLNDELIFNRSFIPIIVFQIENHHYLKEFVLKILYL